MSGTVLVNNMVVDKAGFMIDNDAEIRIKNVQSHMSQEVV